MVITRGIKSFAALFVRKALYIVDGVLLLFAHNNM